MSVHKFVKSFGIDVINDEEMRKFTCWGSVEVKDRHDEIIPIEEVKKVMDIWMDRGAPIMFNHSNRQIGKGLSWQLSEKDGKPGVLITGIIFKHYKTDDDVWKGIKAREFEGLSIGGECHLREPSEEGTYLRKLIGYEFSVVPKCGNQEATFENIAMVKGDNVSQDDKVNNNMKQEELKKEQEELMSEQPAEESMDKEAALEELMSRLDAMSSRLNELEEALSGKPSEDEEVDAEKAEDMEDEKEEEEEMAKEEEEDKEEKACDEKEEKSDEEEDEIKKKLDSQAKEIAELKKALTSTKVIKSERPAEKKVAVEDELDDLALKIAKGEAPGHSFISIGEKIRNAGENDLKKRLNLL